MNIQKLNNRIIENYFLLLTINAIIFLLIPKLAIFEYIVFPLCCYIIGVKYLPKNKTSIFDIIIMIIIIWMCFTWIINDYPNKIILILRCLGSQIAFMMFYLVGKNARSDVYIFFRKSIIPLSICCIIGIYFFFLPPGWYMERIINQENFDGYNLLELTRLKSVFASPYHIAYFCSITSIYMIFCIIKNKEYATNYNKYILLFLLAMSFAMMRAPILCFFISIFIGIFYSIKYCPNSKFLFSIILSICVIIIIGSVIISYIDNNILNFMTSKLDSILNNSDELMDNRLDLGISYNLWGDGAGRHAIYADKYGSPSYRDSEYTKWIIEQGYIGIVIFFTLLFMLFLKCLRHFKDLHFELCILIFFSITMIGANSLTTADKHCFIFWLIAGKIAGYSKQKKYLYE